MGGVSQIACREPQEIVAGDTLTFRRALGNFLASDGWSLVYELRGGAQPIEFVSTADDGSHLVSVAAAVTALWLPAEYVFEGHAVNGEERHRIYFSSVSVLKDQVAAGGDEPQKTFAQKMLAQIEDVLLAKAGDDLAWSRLGDSEFEYMSAEELRTEHGYWSCVRRNEIAKENARNGRPTGNRIRPLFRVISGGVGGVRQF